MKYFGAHGTLEGHAPGLYIVKASGLEAARGKLYSKWKEGRGTQPTETLQEITGEWAEVLRDTIDQIRNKEKEYYTDLGNGVFYVEV